MSEARHPRGAGVKDRAYRDTLDVKQPIAPPAACAAWGVAPEAAAVPGGVRGTRVAGGRAPSRGGPTVAGAFGTLGDEVVERREPKGVAGGEEDRQERSGAATKSRDSKGVDGE